MRIVIDLQGAQSLGSRHRGIGRYSLSLAQALVSGRGEHEVFVALNANFPTTIEPIRAAFEGLLPQDHVLTWAAPEAISASLPGRENRRVQAELVREAFLSSLQPDWVVVTTLFEGFGDDIATSVGSFSSVQTAVVLYDLIPLIHQSVYLQDERLRRWYFSKTDDLKRADLLLAISGSSGREAVDWLDIDPESVVNISTAADPKFRPQPVDVDDHLYLKSTFGIDKPFVMYTGGIDFRKNIEGLISAYARLPRHVRNNHQLAIICSISPDARAKLESLCAKEGLAQGEVLFTGFVSDDDLVLLYNACKLFVFPSWHEGFGLPALEAMLCGKPVLVANRASLPEVVENDAAMFDPFDHKQMANRIATALQDDSFRQSLADSGTQQSKKFGWNLTAQRAWKAMEEKLRSPPRPGSSVRAVKAVGAVGAERPRLAFVSPLPPERTGIADYSSGLLQSLSRWYRIDVVVVKPAEVSDDYVRGSFGILGVDEFRKTSSRYDRVLYQFGNSQFHEHMFDLLEEIPGVVVLHEFILGDIQEWSEAHASRPYAFRRGIYASHGYSALAERFGPQGNSSTPIAPYPANLAMLQSAVGVIVHSDYNRKLADQFYGQGTGKDWAHVPLLRVSEPVVHREQARKSLGIQPNAVVVCSFGLLGQHKLNDALLQAWEKSALSEDANIHLVFVGEAGFNEYGQQMQRAVRTATGNVRITGWVSHETYRAWLSAGDVAVQLRTNTRGETSAAVLDCMNFGLPVIANAHGGMAELDAGAVVLIPDQFKIEQLTQALELLVRDEKLRSKLGDRGREIVRSLHGQRACGSQYADAIEKFYFDARHSAHGLVHALADVCEERDFPALAQYVAQNHPPTPRRRQLLVDVSELCQRDSRSGIQRVVRSVLMEWLLSPPEGFQVEPVFASTESPGYRYARRYTSRFLGLADDWAVDDPVETWNGDVFVGLDLQQFVVVAQERIYEEWRRKGVRVSFVVYDLLPMQMPDYFPDWAPAVHQQWLATIAEADCLVAISRSVAQEVREWLSISQFRRERTLDIGWFHLGADIEKSAPTIGVPSDAPEVLKRLQAAPTFLMVGTLEARKGHAQALAAFGQLWLRGFAGHLVIVGKEGWKADQCALAIRNHPEFGRRLFWFESVSDEFLRQLYQASSCLLALSEGEGFGLPLIEAARYGIPLLARDIPVFREVAGDSAQYFKNDLRPHTVAKAVEAWLKNVNTKQRPNSSQMTFVTWKESAARLLEVVLNGTESERCVARSDGALRFWGSDQRLQTQVGTRRQLSIGTSGRAGILFYGPYARMPAGEYELKVTGDSTTWTGDEVLDVAAKQGTKQVLRLDFKSMAAGPWTVSARLKLETDVDDLEVRLLVAAGSVLKVTFISVEKVRTVALCSN